jgi:predicted nucleic acid-binding Zn ribbon protein
MKTDQTTAPRKCRDCGKTLPPKKAGGRARLRCEGCGQSPRNGAGPCVVCGRALSAPVNLGRVRLCSEKCRQKWISLRYARAAAKAIKRG